MQPRYFSFVHQQTPLAHRIVIEAIAEVIWRYVAIVQPQLSFFYAGESVLQIRFAVAHRFHFRALQLHARLEYLDDFVFVARAPIIGNHLSLRRRLLLFGFLLLFCRRHLDPELLSHQESLIASQFGGNVDVTILIEFRSLFVIKIGPLVATDYGQACALLGLQEEPVLEVQSLTETGLGLRSLAFWQHWLPCQFHVTSSIYVAREENAVLGFISLHNNSKSRTCWRIDNLVVHPEHRGRGIAQELLRFIFAQFGSQGVSHFIAEVSTANEAALSLFASGGFCRSAQVTYYKLIPNSETEFVDTGEQEFHVATPSLKRALYVLHQDALPPDLRMVLNLGPDDFRVKDLLPFTSTEKGKNRLMRSRVWYWVSIDPERRALTSAVRITAQPGLGYRLDMAIHPGWRHLAGGLLNHAINTLLSNVPKMPIWARVYDFQAEVHNVLQARGFERTGDFFLLSREHWQRAKHPKKRKVELKAPLNLPLVPE